MKIIGYAFFIAGLLSACAGAPRSQDSGNSNGPIAVTKPAGAAPVAAADDGQTAFTVGGYTIACSEAGILLPKSELILPPGFADAGSAFTFSDLVLDRNDQSKTLKPGRGESGQALDYSWNGWTFRLYDLTLSSDGGLGARASVVGPDEGQQGQILFLSFSALPSGGFVLAAPSEQPEVFIHNWRAKLSEASFAADGNLNAETCTVELYSIMGGESLTIPDLAISPAGRIVACGVGTAPIAFLSTNLFQVETDSVTFAADGLRLGGRIRRESDPSDNDCVSVRIDVDYAPGEIFLDGDGRIATEARSETVPFQLAGFNLDAESGRFQDGYFQADNAILHLALSGRRIDFNLGPLNVGPYDPTLRCERLSDSFIPLSEFGGITLYGMEFIPTGIAATALVALPPNFAGQSLYFDQLVFKPDGTFYSESTYDEFNYDYYVDEANQEPSLRFRFLETTVDADGFYVGEAAIRFPQAFGGQKLNALGLKIGLDGSMALENFDSEPMEFLGYIFTFSGRLSFADGVLGLSGRVQLPDTMPDGLAGMEIPFSKLEIDLNDNTVVFAAEAETDLAFPLTDDPVADDWIVQADGFIIQGDGERFLVGIPSGVVEIPAGTGRRAAPALTVPIRNMTIDPITGEMSHDPIEAAPGVRR